MKLFYKQNNIQQVIIDVSIMVKYSYMFARF